MELAPLVQHIRRFVAVETDPDRELLERYLAGDGGGSPLWWAARSNGARRLSPSARSRTRRRGRLSGDFSCPCDATRGRGNREALASFLHAVALRTARKAPRAGGGPSFKASPIAPRRNRCPTAMRSELAAVLDEEIVKLPEWCREAFVLCHLQGQSVAQTARRLGCPRHRPVASGSSPPMPGPPAARTRRHAWRTDCPRRGLALSSGRNNRGMGGPALAGQAMTSFVSRWVLELTLYGGKMGKIVPCFLFLALTVGFAAVGGGP